MKQYYRFDLYVPTLQASKVKNAMFDAGGGRLGKYERCCWETTGKGQFFCGASSHPAVGTVGNMQFVDETKIEMIVAADCLQAVVDAMLAKHPYEMPAFSYYPVGIGFAPVDDTDGE